MTSERLEELLSYYKASKQVLESTYQNNPEKFNQQGTEMALGLFEDTINILEYVKQDSKFIGEVKQSVIDDPISKIINHQH